MVLNPSILYSTRLWPDLGVDLYIIKVRAPLPKLISEAGSYATGKVRVDCIQGLRKLGQLRWEGADIMFLINSFRFSLKSIIPI